MRGDVDDISGRIRAVLPSGWFADLTPNLNAVLKCLATPWSWLYSLVQYVIQQTRIATADGGWLDLIAFDFSGDALRRHDGEVDSAYRGRIRWTLMQGAATRIAIVTNVQRLTGFVPVVFEPANCGDTGAYGGAASGSFTSYAGLAYGMTGGWGNLGLPYQFFITAKRPVNQGVASLAGYGTSPGGYGVGMIAYVDLALLVGSVSDNDIAAFVSNIVPLNTTAWLRLN